MADKEGMARLPMPAHLPPQANPARSLAIKVNGYFRALYESTARFRERCGRSCFPERPCLTSRSPM